MMGNHLELLAPAGKMEVLHSVINAGADAVYLGGKRFNMRGLRADYNFSDDELKEAVAFVHDRHRKLYITLNNLYYSSEIDEVSQYLLFLKELGIDAVIVQDLGIVTLCKDLKLDIPLHASVQMGVANLEAVKLLEEQGFTRVILSKNVSLSEIREIASGTRLGIEFFVHGDLCVSHTGQCYMSSIMSGEGGNRGKCLKPCRWQYQLLGEDLDSAEYKYYLAHKDLCLYPFLPQLIGAGVSSFKVEGRMRSARFLKWLVSTYRRALDRYLEQPESYQTNENEVSILEQNRIRNYTTGSLINPLDWKVIDFEGDREPIKSNAVALPLLQPPEDIVKASPVPSDMPQLTVRVGGLEALEAIKDLSVDNIVLANEIIRQNKQNWTLTAVTKASELMQGSPSRIFVETPRVVSQKDLAAIATLKQKLDGSGISGIVVNDLGSLKIFRNSGLEIWAGYGLNTCNHIAAGFLAEQETNRITASLEMNQDNIEDLLQTGIPTEIMVQGPLPCMVSDYCVIHAVHADRDSDCSCYCHQGQYYLMDREGQKYRIISDDRCRTYLYAPYDLCLMTYLPQLAAHGAKSFRIDGQFYESGKLREVIAIYQEALGQIKTGVWQPQHTWSRISELFPNGLTGGVFTSKRL